MSSLLLKCQVAAMKMYKQYLTDWLEDYDDVYDKDSCCKQVLIDRIAIVNQWLQDQFDNENPHT